MLVLSFRDMSTATDSAVTTAAVYDLGDVEPAFVWSPPPPYTLAQWDAVKRAWQGKHVCFLVHGFNCDRDNGYTGFGAAAQEMGPGAALPSEPDPPGAFDLQVGGVDVVVPVLWSGDWYLPINYPFLLPNVRLTGKYFAQLILSSATQMSRVSFVTHSMGARVVLETIQQTLALAAKTPGARAPLFETAMFTAAATSDEVLDDPDYADAVGAVQKFVVVSSRSDTVLSGAFPLGNAVEQALWPNDPGADDALGRYGPRLKPGSPALPKTQWYEVPPNVGQDHNDYFPWPWQPVAPYLNGWSGKRVNIGLLSQAVLDHTPAGWISPSPISPRN
jgi:hypothetical protein